MPGSFFGRRDGRWALVASLALLAAAPAASAQVTGDGAGGEAPTYEAPLEGRVAPDRVIVKYKEGARFSTQAEIRKQEGLRKEKDLGLIDAEVVDPRGRSAEAAARDLEARPDVEYAVPDRPLYRFGYGDEPRFGELWGLNNTGQAVTTPSSPGGPGTPDVDVNALEASSITKGDSSVTVAVIDDGVDFSHPDLAGQAWVNPGESGGGKEANGVDDDGNGYVDDVNGWDFYNGDNTTHDALEDGHGTHVAGTVAAAENGEGVVGVAPGVRIMGLKFIGPATGMISDAIPAIEYARAQGADVINASWGCVGCPPEDYLPLEEAIEASGILFVAAAGNSEGGLDNDNPDPGMKAFPASFDSPNILSVAAADNTGQLAPFSHYGAESVDVAAPGVDVLSSIPGTPSLPAAALSTVDEGEVVIDTPAAGPGKALVSGFGVEEIRRLADQEAFMKRALSAVGRTNEPVVLVDDDMSDASETANIPDVRLPLRNAVEEATGQRPEVINVARGDGPSAEQLRGKVVVWSTGYAFASSVPDPASGQMPATTLTPADQQVLTEFLTGGGKLVVSGMDAMLGIEETPFVKATLGLSVQSDRLTFAFEGSPGTAFAGAGYPFGGAYALPFFHDVVSPAEGSLTAQQGDYPGDPDGWEYHSGTSMAAPHAAGAAALVASAKPELRDRPVALKDVLTRSAKPLPATQGLTVTGGMVDSRAALEYTPPPPADRIAPSVTRVSPAAGARRVAPAANVAAAFSERMNAGTLNRSTFTLVRKGTSTPIAATVTYNPSTNVATLNPKANLRRGATYRATVTTGARDLAGNPLAAKRTWTFTVRR